MHPAAALALCVILAGCSSGPAPSPSSTSDPAIITDPTDLEASRDGRPHVHDYWRGEPTHTLYSGTIELAKDNLVHGLQMIQGGAQRCSPDVGPYSGCALLDIEDGDTVYPGTGWINITAEVSFSGPLAGKSDDSIIFAYDAPDRKPTRSIIPFTTGTYSINITEPMADLAHARVTQWEFRLELAADFPYGGTATVDLEMEIVRGPDPIPEAPAHPDFWGTNQTLDLVVDEGNLHDIACRGTQVAHVERPSSTVFPYYFPNPAHPVMPVETTTLELTLWYNSSTHPAVHYDPLLSWHGADKKSTWEQEGVPPTSSQVRSVDGFYHWELEVKPRMYDSPYSNQTAWFIYVPWSGTIDGCGGPHAMKGDFHLLLRALR